MSRASWAEMARGWEANADEFRRHTMPVSAWMVDAIAPQPGQTILDLAAGIGDTGFLAAELIEPGGTLITSDVVPEMLSAAQRRAARLALRNVRFKQVDLERPIDLETASMDAVLCRWGYMLVDDPEAALKETRRVLRPGGRLALAAWTAAEENQWSALPLSMLVERGRIEPLEPGPGQFAWADHDAIPEHLEAAGFVEYELQPLDFTMRYPSVPAWWESVRATGRAAHDADVRDEAAFVAELTAAARGWMAPDGSLAIPASTWVAVATG